LEKIRQENNVLFKQSSSLKDQNDLLESKYQDLLAERKYVNDKGFYAINSLQKELQQKDLEIETLQSHMKEKEGVLRVYSITQEHTVRSHDVTALEIEKLKRENSELKEKIDSLENQLEDFYMNRRSESALLLEVEHLKQDNLRLLNLLKSTEDYKDFAYLAEDCSGGVMFVKGRDEVRIPTANSSRRAASVSGTSAKASKYGRKENVESSSKNEDNWIQIEVPSSTYI
jgi:hypothetical protein